MKTYQKLATLLGAIANCNKVLDNEHSTEVACKNADEWVGRHQEDIDLIMTMFPSGSGFDSGTNLEQLSKPCSTPEKLIFTTSYHYMNDSGYYDGWTEHKVIVTASLQSGYNIKVTGKDKNHIKDYIGDEFCRCLDSEV